LRSAILSDLSPAACHISYNYTHPTDPDLVKTAYDQIHKAIRDEIDKLYRTDYFVPAVGEYDLAGAEVRWRCGDAAAAEPLVALSSMLPHSAESGGDNSWK